MAQIHKKRPTIVKRQTTFHAKNPKKQSMFGTLLKGAKVAAKGAKYFGKGLAKGAKKTVEFVQSDAFQKRVEITSDFSRRGMGLKK